MRGDRVPRAHPAPRACAQRMNLLSNGRYSVLLGPDGTGCSLHDGYALTRWIPDAVTPAHGCFVWIRDADTGDFHSLTARPFGSVPACADVEATIRVCVVGDSDLELRMITLTNHATIPRRFELTTCAELALSSLEADAGHPAFSRLFVQTAFDAEREALLAWRRLRSPGDRPMWGAHRLLAPEAPGPDADQEVDRIQFETDRARFVGRGATLDAPAALTARAPLSGTAGNVLDPVFCLRRSVALRPGGGAQFCVVLAAGRTRDDVLAALDGVPTLTAAAVAFDRAASAAMPDMVVPGIPESWRGAIDIVGDAGASADRGVVHLDSPATSARDVGHGERTAVPRSAPTDKSPPVDPGLELFNGLGGFTADGREYVIRIVADGRGHRLPPLPWCNVVANAAFGFLVSETGAASTWALNSRENRLTPWSNDPVSDPHTEALYVRDDATRAFWSPTPGPVRAGGDHEVRHGFGYTRFLHVREGVRHDTCMFVAEHDPVRFVRVELTNDGAEARQLSVFSCAQLVLGGLPQETRGCVETRIDCGAVIRARNPHRGEFSVREMFATAIAPDGALVHATTDRAAFIGMAGTAADPAGVRDADALDGAAGAGIDACAALQCTVMLPPGQSRVITFLLGEGDDEAVADALLARYATGAAVDDAFERVRDGWRALLDGVRIETPVPALDVMVNGWLSYQNLVCRMWGRTAFYQSGGAFGFRDQLQDSMALLYMRPAWTRAQILLHAAHQFPEGDVLHWWHPPLAKGIRTRFSDDLLWLPYVTRFYIEATGDRAVLDERAGWVKARHLDAGEDEAFVFPERTDGDASLYEHCCRALDRSLTEGAHGLPLIGVGDWNDGMNRVGREGRGESVWLGFFLFDILGGFIPLCDTRGDAARADAYRAYRSRLHNALNDGGWDGDWYRRAYYDSGVPLGSATSDECQIDTIAQAWAVLSGAAPADRASRALAALDEHLVSEEDGLIRLLTPAFDRTPHDPGYIKGYLPGVRENGGQYTHAALWAVRAFAEMGLADRAAALLSMLSPVSHTADATGVARYRAEPYVVAADVYGVAPHVGRGGWTWYTGSAGWMFRVALESILGFALHGGRHFALRPCVPADWPGFTLHYTLPDDGTRYTFAVERVAPVTAGAAPTRTIATLDGVGVTLEDGAVLVPILRDGATHTVHVRLGDDVGRRYVPEPA
jgi:N,N'-diacetylchitobiose phosphorylase